MGLVFFHQPAYLSIDYQLGLGLERWEEYEGIGETDEILVIYYTQNAFTQNRLTLRGGIVGACFKALGEICFASLPLHFLYK